MVAGTFKDAAARSTAIKRRFARAAQSMKEDESYRPARLSRNLKRDATTYRMWGRMGEKRITRISKRLALFAFFSWLAGGYIRRTILVSNLRWFVPNHLRLLLGSHLRKKRKISLAELD